MTKTKWGLVLVGGLFFAFIGAQAAGNMPTGSPRQDFVNDLLFYLYVAIALSGIAMFFVGAVKYSRFPTKVEVVDRKDDVSDA